VLIAPAWSSDAIAVVDSHVKCLLGGVRDQQWMTSKAAIPMLNRAGIYRAVMADGTASAVTLSEPHSAGGACEGTIEMETSPAPSSGKPFVVIGGEWKAQPRPVVNLIAGKGRYTAAIQWALEERGVEGTPEIRQLLRTDLDGDGKDEVIAVVAGRSKQYSAVLVRKLIEGRVKTLVATLEKDKEGDAPSEHTVALVADLNGDGTAEIVVHGRYTQGIFTVVYALEKEKVRQVLSCACGG